MTHDFADTLPDMSKNARAASDFLKALSHETRLMILCHLTTGERSVKALEDLLGTAQATVSQHLARLRHDGLVSTRRDGKTVYYSIADPDALGVLKVLHQKYCA